MNAAGFDYDMLPFVRSKEFAPDFLVLERSDLASDGFTYPQYFTDGRFKVSDAETRNRERGAAISGYLAVLGGEEGPDNVSCRRTATTNALGEDHAEAWFEAIGWVQNLRIDVQSMVRADPRATAVEAQWADCIRGSGYAYASRDDLATAKWPEPRPSGEEIAAALADYDCRGEVSYADIYRSVWKDSAAAVIEANEGQLAEYRSIATTAVDVAVAFLDQE